MAVLNGLSGQWIEKNDDSPPVYHDQLPEYLWTATTAIYLKASERPASSQQLLQLLHFGCTRKEWVAP